MPGFFTPDRLAALAGIGQVLSARDPGQISGALQSYQQQLALKAKREENERIRKEDIKQRRQDFALQHGLNESANQRAFQRELQAQASKDMATLKRDALNFQNQKELQALQNDAGLKNKLVLSMVDSTIANEQLGKRHQQNLETLRVEATTRAQLQKQDQAFRELMQDKAVQSQLFQATSADLVRKGVSIESAHNIATALSTDNMASLSELERNILGASNLRGDGEDSTKAIVDFLFKDADNAEFPIIDPNTGEPKTDYTGKQLTARLPEQDRYAMALQLFPSDAHRNLILSLAQLRGHNVAATDAAIMDSEKKVTSTVQNLLANERMSTMIGRAAGYFEGSEGRNAPDSEIVQFLDNVDAISLSTTGQVLSQEEKLQVIDQFISDADVRKRLQELISPNVAKGIPDLSTLRSRNNSFIPLNRSSGANNRF